MLRLMLLCLLAVHALSATTLGQALAGPTKSPGILVLDNCDDQFKGKDHYKDNLTLFDQTGKKTFRVSGFNNCESIGSSRMVAPDPARNCIWVVENAAHRIRRFDLAGIETLAIPEVKGSAIAVDPETGNLWAIVDSEHIGVSRTAVYNNLGKEVVSFSTPGYDIVYDRKTKAFWIADRTLTKITAAEGQVVSSVPVATWCASSVDVDPMSGAAWVAVRKHPQVPRSTNRLLKFGGDGGELVAIELGERIPFRLSVDGKDGSVWVAFLRNSVERFSAVGKSEAKYAVDALAVEVDHSGGNAWVVTPTEILKMAPNGEVLKRASHAGRTSQAWIAPLK
jgi:hypothetical protein